MGKMGVIRGGVMPLLCPCLALLFFVSIWSHQKWNFYLLKKKCNERKGSASIFISTWVCLCFTSMILSRCGYLDSHSSKYIYILNLAYIRWHIYIFLNCYRKWHPQTPHSKRNKILEEFCGYHIYCAIFTGWAWARESKKEIIEAKLKIEQDIVEYKTNIKNYKEEIVNLENDLNRERKTVAILKTERENYHNTLEKESRWEESANEALSQVEIELMRRQDIYCSPLKSKESRMKVERQLMKMAGQPPLARLNLQDDLIKIFEKDNFCASYFNDNRRNNGRLWLDCMESWRTQVACLKHKKAEECLKGQPTKK